MKPLLALCNEDSMHTRGGVSVLVEELIQGLAGHYRILLASGDAAGTLPSHLVPLLEGHIPVDPSATTPAGRKAFAEELQRWKVDLAHFHLPGVYGWGTRIPGHSPIPLVHKAGIATVATSHLAQSLLRGYCGPSRPAWFRLLLLPRSWLGKVSVLRSLDAEIAVSRRDYRQFRKWFFPVRDRFRHIYHSRIRAARLPSSDAPREKALLAVGHVAFRKGQLVLAEAFAKIAARFPDWKLWIIGHAAEEACRVRLEQMIRANDLGGRVELLGRRDDPQAWMKRASIYVQPSYFEGLPLSLQEALACGCACVGTRIPGNEELIDEGANGFLVPAGDAAALGDALAKLMADENLCRNLSSKAPASIIEKKMNYEAMIQEHRNLYDSILSKNLK